jgi:hypothetical protein
VEENETKKNDKKDIKIDKKKDNEKDKAKIDKEKKIRDKLNLLNL